MTTTDLASKTLEMLDLQKKFFETKNYSLLQQSKRLEKQVREACEAIVNKTSGMSDLFNTTKTEGNGDS